MRLDKFLKISRLIKRRTVANELADAGRVTINGKVAKPGTKLKTGDIICLKLGEKEVKVKVCQLLNTVRKDEATKMYEIL